jgi:hypothetical protein
MQVLIISNEKGTEKAVELINEHIRQITTAPNT